MCKDNYIFGFLATVKTFPKKTKELKQWYIYNKT